MLCSKRETNWVVGVSLWTLQTPPWQRALMYCALIGSSQQVERQHPQLMTANMLPESDLNWGGLRPCDTSCGIPPPNTLQMKKLDPICQLPSAALTTSQVWYSTKEVVVWSSKPGSRGWTCLLLPRWRRLWHLWRAFGSRATRKQLWRDSAPAAAESSNFRLSKI